MTLYSANNTPYSAMSGVMTGDCDERTVLSSYPLRGGDAGAADRRRVHAAARRQVRARQQRGRLAEDDDAVGGRSASSASSSRSSRRASASSRRRSRSPIAQADFKNLLKNGPWIAMFVLTLSHFVFVAMRGGTMFYYFSYYVDKTKLLEFLQGLGLPQATAASPDGGHYADERARADPRRRSLERRVGRIQPVQHREPAHHGHRRRVRRRILAMRFGKRAVALVGLRARRRSSWRRSSSCRPTRSARRTDSRWCARCRTRRPFRSSGRCSPTRGLRRVEDGPSHDGRGVRDDSVRAQDGLSLGGAIAGWLLSGYGYQPNVDADRHTRCWAFGSR